MVGLQALHLHVELLHYVQLPFLLLQQFIEARFPELLGIGVPLIELQVQLLLLQLQLQMKVLLLPSQKLDGFIIFLILALIVVGPSGILRMR